MLAIPYYFWSESETPSMARKDVMERPMPSLTPPRFNFGPGKNEINGRKHPKRRRPNNGLTPPPPGLQTNANKFPKLPPGADPKSIYDKQYRNWYNNHFFQQFNQFPPGATPPPGGRVVLPPIHPGQNPGNLIGHRPPFPHLQTGIPHLNPVGVTQGAPATHQALIGAHVQEIMPHPLLHGGGPRVDGMLSPPTPQSSPRVEVRPGGASPHGHQLQRQDGARFPQSHFPAEEVGKPPQKQIGVLPQIIPSANRREIIGLQAPQPNSIFEENFDILNQKPPPPPPGAAGGNPSSGNEGHNVNSGQFVPTHIEHQTSGHVRAVDGQPPAPVQGHHPGLPVLHQRPVFGQAPGPVPGQATRPVSVQAPGQTPGQAPGPVPGQAHGQAPGQAHGQAPGQAHGQAPGQAHGQAPGQAHGQVPGQAPGQAPAQAPGPVMRQVPGQGPTGHPHAHLPPGVSFPPAQRVQWRAHHPLAQPPRRHIHPGAGNPGLLAGRHPGLNHLPQFGNPQAPRVLESPRLLGGVPRVPGISRTPTAHESILHRNLPSPSSPKRPTDRAPASALVTPLLPPPPPPPQGQTGSGEDNKSFGAFKNGRDGNTHFKVSFEAGDVNEIQGEKEEKEQQKEVINDSQAQESVRSGTTFVIVRPPNAVSSEAKKQDNILDLSKSQWQKVPQEQSRHQQVLSQNRPLVVTVGNKQQANAQHQKQQQQHSQWQLQQQERQQQARQEAKKQQEEQQQQEKERQIRQQQEREAKEQQKKERQEQQQQRELALKKQQQLEKQRWQEQQKRELQQKQQKQEAPSAQPLVQHNSHTNQHMSQEVRQQQQQSQFQNGPSRSEGAQPNSEDGFGPSSGQFEPPASDETRGRPRQPLHIQHFLQQQELRHKEYLKLQQQEAAKAQLGTVSHENEFSATERSSSLYKEEQGGFVPIYGPPTPPHELIIRPTTERYELPKPSAFLDKLKAEQEKSTSNLRVVEAERVSAFRSMEKENEKQNDRTSNIEISRGEPVKLSPENFESAAEKFLAESSNKVEISTQSSAPVEPPKFTPTQAPPAIFVRKPTSRTGVPLIVTPVRPTKYRVVTSKSVVTSVPVSLSQKYPSAYNVYETDKESSTSVSTQEQVDEVYNDLVDRQTEEVEPTDENQVEFLCREK
ncbi:hypothetical protein FHG87_021567 [Trinorchestia longiramus]|nr:hypothetical protein FHG87_021567 [Trinorchestia longiramus]